MTIAVDLGRKATKQTKKLSLYIIAYRLKEEQLNKKMEHTLDSLQADHLRESQELVNQFNQAQELLKDKISELQIM